MQTLDQRQLTLRLLELRAAHRDLDAALAALVGSVPCDELSVKRMKKRKLALKDQIAWIEDQLIPDLNA